MSQHVFKIPPQTLADHGNINVARKGRGHLSPTSVPWKLRNTHARRNTSGMQSPLCRGGVHSWISWQGLSLFTDAMHVATAVSTSHFCTGSAQPTPADNVVESVPYPGHALQCLTRSAVRRNRPPRRGGESATGFLAAR